MATYTDQVSGVSIETDGPLTAAEIDAAFAPTPDNIQRYAVNEGAKLGIPAPTVLGVLGTESQSDVNAVSPKGARGAMQVMPDTADQLQRQYGIDMADPFGRVKGGLLYLRDQFNDFKDPTLALAAYNAGPEAVRKYGGVPPYAETQQYVRKIPTEGWGAPPSQMDHPTNQELRAGRSPVDIPDVATLIAANDHPVTDELAAQRQGLAARYTDEGIAKMAVPLALAGAPAAAAMVPAAQALGLGSSAAQYAGAGMVGGLSSLIATTAKRLERKGLGDFSRSDYRDIGLATLGGSAMGVAMHGITNAIFGAPAPDRRAAEQVLGGPQVPPVNPAGQAQLGASVEDAVQGALPAVARDQVGEAYDAFKAGTQGRSIDVTDYNATLARYANKHFPDEGIAAPGGILAPIGREVSRPSIIPGGEPVTRWYATADELVARDKGIRWTTAQKNPVTGASTLPGGLMRKLGGDIKDAVRSALTPEEGALYQAARDTAREYAQREAGMTLLRGTLTGAAGQGIPEANATMLARTLERNAPRWQGELGRELYQQVLTIAQAGRTLATQPGGRALFAQLLARLPGAGIGWAVGTMSGGGTGAAVTGGVMGAALPPQLLLPGAMRIVEGLARHRQSAGQITEAAGRLAVAFAVDQIQPPTVPVDQPAPSPSLGPGMP